MDAHANSAHTDFDADAHLEDAYRMDPAMAAVSQLDF
jgi:hypothetical protein